MKQVLMMILTDCHYCRKALGYMEEVEKEYPQYKAVKIRIADEKKEKELADSLDYYYVPTYFVDGRKVHEGVPTKEKVQAVYEEALKKE